MLVNVNNSSDDSGYDWSPSEDDLPVSSGIGVKVTFGNGFESDNPNFNIYEIIKK